MQSRFFKRDSDSESETESEQPSSDEEEQKVGGVARPSRFAVSDSDEEDDEKRVVRSTKDRRFDALREIAVRVRNHSKIGDWSALQTEFDMLNKQLDKIRVKDLVTGQLPPVPDLYLAVQVMLEETFDAAQDAKAKLSRKNNKAFNTTRQRVKKNARQYEEELRRYRENGGTGDLRALVEGAGIADDEKGNESSDDDTQSDSSYSSTSGAASDSDSASDANEKPSTQKATKEDEEDSDSDSWGTDGSTSDDDSDSDEGGPAGKSRVSRWLKKDDADERSTRKKIVKDRERKSNVKRELDSDEDDEEGLAGVDEISEKDAKELTLRQVDEKMAELLASRGKRGTDRLGQIRKVELLLRASKSNRQRTELLLHLVSSLFDFTPSHLAYMPRENWKDALNHVSSMLQIAKDHHPRITFASDTDVVVAIQGEKTLANKTNEDAGVETASRSPEELAQEEQDAGGKEDEKECVVRGDIASLVERLDDEMFKAWQNMDAYSATYVERLQDENPFMCLLMEALDYYMKTVNDLSRAARVASRMILHLYYKSSDIMTKLKELFKTDGNEKLQVLIEAPSIQDLAVLVYRYGDDRSKSQTMLCHIYHHALSDRFYAARDLLLMSHLQESITDMDIPMQVLFNRTMAQLGLCAFRLGKPFEAHACLQDLYPASFSGGMRTKELLAQGFVPSRGSEKTPEAEKAEKRRQVPYHMHLNLDLLETAHLVSAMLLEVPNWALNQISGMKRRVISKTFQYYLRSAMKQSFPGPPENTRDHVVTAARCLMKGDWKRCYDFISQMRVWKGITPDVAEATLRKVQDLIKVEGLRTFVVTYSVFYDSMGIADLSERFLMDPSKVHSVISKMIINEEIRASWDQPTRTVVVQRAEPSRLQALALEMAQKCTFLVEQNEKLMDAKIGGLAGKDGEREEWGDRKNRMRRGPRDRYRTGHENSSGYRARHDVY
uniref:Eukaryotic translation initiation factor 3 subunit C n=1 Tax=Compsopogon caeruleus TaxID=31354 RepID=A0A7S1TC81_9RHOD|mmetsp:Transcript_17223/g.35784  ORF Transcript_17223/g.35784 Transcript_17223/m.35784 type:complete len:950 (+) Transcript_17223:53-2902(+)